MKSGLLLVASLAIALYFTDLEHASAVQSILLPILDGLLLIALALWLVLSMHRRGIDQTASRHSSGGGDWGGFDGGGD